MGTAESDASDEYVLAAIYRPLMRFAGVVAPRHVDPEDLVHEALARTLEKRSLSSLEYPSAYLRRAILNLASNRRRSVARQVRALVRLSDPAPALDDYPSETMALLDLAPESRAILWLADVEGWPFDRIASELGLSSGAARQRASRGRAEIRRRFEAGEFDTSVSVRGAEL